MINSTNTTAPPNASLGLPLNALRRLAARILQRKNANGLLGFAIIIAVIVVALLAPHISTQEPARATLSARLQPPGWSAQGTTYLFGTDELGRDVFSRVLYGARISLLVGFTSVFISGIIGVLLGLLAGYYGKLLGSVIMRFVDIQVAFPFIVLAIAALAVLGSSIANLITVLAIGSWVIYCRLVWSLTISLKEMEFVMAARALGCTDWRIIWRHILPNTLSPISIIASYQFATMVVAEAALSFLGLGVPPPTPSWGSIISGGRLYLTQAWWIAAFPGLALVLTTLGITLVGDWVSEYASSNA